jgi:hypothetical protein
LHTKRTPKQNSILCFLSYLLFKFFSVLLSLRNGIRANTSKISLLENASLFVARAMLTISAGIFLRLNRGTLMNSRRTISVEAEPYVYEFEPAHSALVIIDMQRIPWNQGFGEMAAATSHSFAARSNRTGGCAAWRAEGLKVIHSGRARPDLTDLPPAKRYAATARLRSAIQGQWAEY